MLVYIKVKVEKHLVLFHLKKLFVRRVEQHGIELDKKKIVLQEAIKNFGAYEVAIKLHLQVTGTLKVKVQEEK